MSEHINNLILINNKCVVQARRQTRKMCEPHPAFWSGKWPSAIGEKQGVVGFFGLFQSQIYSPLSTPVIHHL